MDQPRRKIIRLQEYDYCEAGMYFITLCTHQNAHLFWLSNQAVLSPAGDMVARQIHQLSQRFPNIRVDCYAVMPNHVHLLLWLRCRQPKPLSAVVQWFKIVTTNGYIRGVRQGLFPPYQDHLWQRSFYDHVIRTRNSLAQCREYILNNPEKWEQDRFYRGNPL